VNLLVIIEELNVASVYQHSDMLSFQIPTTIATTLDIHEEGLLFDVLDCSVETHVAGGNAEELVNQQVGLSHSID